jgi:hypothetical protein
VFECEGKDKPEYFLNFAKIFSDVFQVSSNVHEEFLVLVMQGEKRVITHPCLLIKKNYKIINHCIHIFGQEFELGKTMICLGCFAVFADEEIIDY